MSRIVLAANYNCSDSTNNAYGAGEYNTCETDTATTPAADTTQQQQQQTTTSPAAPNTGFLQQFYESGSFTILAPLVIAIIAVAISAFVLKRKSSRR